MKGKKQVIKERFFVFLFSIVLFGCKPLISLYDQYAYTQTTSIKVDVLNVMDLASEDFQLHQKEVDNIQTSIRKIYEYDKNRPRNAIITKMWQKIIDTSGHLFGGFIKRWKNEKKLSKIFIDDAKNSIVGPAFDQVAELESKKSKPSQITTQ